MAFMNGYNRCSVCGTDMESVGCPDGKDGCLVLHLACPKCRPSNASFSQFINHLKNLEREMKMGWTCPQCGVNYSPNVVRCPCTEKKNQEPPKDKSILDGMPVVTNKEFNFKAEHKTI